jgi:hypothetical protein
MGKQFIVVKGYVNVPVRSGKRPKEFLFIPKVVVAHFISTKTLVVKRSLTVDADIAIYDKRLLFILIHGRVRIYDVSGTFYRDLHLQKNASNFVDSLVFLVLVNSRYVAILYRIEKSYTWKTMFTVYKLEALKIS